MNRILMILFLLSAYFYAPCQEVFTQAYEFRKEAAQNSVLLKYPARSIGPVVQGGRVTDIEVHPNDLNTYYVAYASGGIFKTTDNGITFTPVFDDQDALGLGDIALAPTNPSVIYAGTGEKNSSRSSYAGSGMYKSTDAGETWSFLGLAQTHHISRVIVHPENPDVVWVAAAGALYSANDARGVYKSTDGGQSWEKTLFVNDSTGIIDLVINPANPEELLAASWERTRLAWNFKGDGPGSAIYKSTDGGMTWAKSVKGFPEGNGVGRIGLAVSAARPDRYYALIDNQKTKTVEEETEESDDLTLEDFTSMSVSEVAAIDNEKLEKFLRDNRFPRKYDAQQVKSDLKEGTYKPEDIANYYGDANEELFNSEVIGAELYRSDDHGDTWKKINSYDLDGVYFTYGYYFGEVRVAPDDPDQVYIFGVPLLKSLDGGVHYTRIDTAGDVHVDHQSLWINPQNNKHLRLGNDGGLYESFDQGGHWRHINNMPVGQFYTVNVDNDKPYNVYGGLQDNGTLRGPSTSIPNRTPFWEALFGGDGMFVAPDPRNSSLVYVGFQFGNYFRINMETGERARLSPSHDIGEDIPRYNWRTPLKLSSHNADVVYMGSQRLYRSMDKGDTWRAISPDLTRNLPQGNVPYSTISTFSESPLQFGKVYVGTDDGNVQVSSGAEWKNITGNLPDGKWVSTVFASPHDAQTVYVSLNGYREDDFKTYLFMSADDGKTWTSLKGDLPEVVVNEIIEDPMVANLLYLGTDHGLYISFNGGENWSYAAGVPNVAVYDMIVHPRDNDLVIATHGRSMFVMDVTPLQKVAQSPAELIIFADASLRFSEQWGEQPYKYTEAWEPDYPVQFYAPEAGDYVFTVVDSSGSELVKEKITAKKGFNSFKWDVALQKGGDKKERRDNGKVYASKGVYTVNLTGKGSAVSQELEIK